MRSPKSYTERELVAIARRENNQKRVYLVLNRLQGKHIPVSPAKAFSMFDALGELVKGAYQDEALLLVGFAETATAIGASLAIQLNTLYMQTTREKIEGVEYLYFSEEHSHATEQKLIKTDLDFVVDQIDRIVFVEDEVTTGNTILNMICVIQKNYQNKIRFAVASLLNGMDEKARKRYEELEIPTHYLVKTNHENYTEIAGKYKGDGKYIINNGMETVPDFSEYEIGDYLNARRLNRGEVYLKACESLWENVQKKVGEFCSKKILVLGTEECMYPALFIARMLEQTGNIVKCHSTTRSPIEVSSELEYPVHVRCGLPSLYDKTRKTFLYNLEKYEEVLILTDANCKEQEGIRALIHALSLCGNTKIYFIRWC
ncbi:MAG: hypothetical protein HFI37_07455 [Lachnospiraceae bacterium]|nr:hypothetical protein [Lachnospiraceae bacterium]